MVSLLLVQLQTEKNSLTSCLPGFDENAVPHDSFSIWPRGVSARRRDGVCLDGYGLAGEIVQHFLWWAKFAPLIVCSDGELQNARVLAALLTRQPISERSAGR